MKAFRILVAIIAIMTFALAASAQHGRTMGTPAGGHSMGHQPNLHSTSAKTNSHGQRTIDQKLTANTQLAGKISNLAGMSAQDACAGFKNLGQCVAAAHVSSNLGLKFVELKDTMLALNPDGTPSTTAKPMSLGKAIQTLAPQADAKAELKKAKQQTNSDTQATATATSGSGS
jgi:hypothetical protein